jgi:glyoxylase-like metal-dependent hydrolase (beta-lactamase superfamily II)
LIIPLHGGNPSAMTGSGNWTYFLPGHYPVLIDAGVGEATHIAAIAESRADGPQHVLVTHGHSDHISGVAAIANRWTDTAFSKYPWPERDSNYAVQWRLLHDGERVPAGDGTLEVIHTPGHSPDHVALWDEESRTIFSGDLVVMGTTVVIPATMGGRLTAYIQSLRRLLALNPARLLPAHGPAIDDPQTIIRRYLSHREEREAQIRAALSEGLSRVEAIVQRIYVGLLPALVPMARESVLAHLVKLEDEHAVRRQGEEWHLI